MHANAGNHLKRLPVAQRALPAQLLGHARNRQITHRGGAFYYDEREPLRGLLPTLKDALWAHTEFRDHRAAAKYQKGKSDATLVERRKRERARARATPNSSAGKGWHHGRYRGSSVHQQLEDFVNHTPAFYQEKHGKQMHPFGLRVLKSLRAQGWVPLVAEFQVFDRGLGVGTAIDLIYVNRANGKLVMIELKTGYTNYFDASTRTMTGPLAGLIPCSPLNQAAIQLMMGMLLVCKHHRIPLSSMEGYVVRVDDHQVQRYPVQQVFIDAHAKAIYRHIWKSQKARKSLKARKRARAANAKRTARPSAKRARTIPKR